MHHRVASRFTALAVVALSATACFQAERIAPDSNGQRVLAVSTDERWVAYQDDEPSPHFAVAPIPGSTRPASGEVLDIELVAPEPLARMPRLFRGSVLVGDGYLWRPGRGVEELPDVTPRGLSPDGTTLLTTHGRDSVLHRLTSGDEIPLPDCLAWAFSPDSRRLALARSSGDLEVYDTQSGALLWSGAEAGSPVLFWLDGERVVATTADDLVVVTAQGVEAVLTSFVGDLLGVLAGPLIVVATAGDPADLEVIDVSLRPAVRRPLRLRAYRAYLGSLLFAPDGRSLAFFGAQDPGNPFEATTVRVDLPGLGVETIARDGWLPAGYMEGSRTLLLEHYPESLNGPPYTLQARRRDQSRFEVSTSDLQGVHYAIAFPSRVYVDRTWGPAARGIAVWSPP